MFDPQSEAEATTLLDLLGTAVRDTTHHALLTDPVYMPGGDNQEIDTWLSKRSGHEAGAYRRLLNIGILSAASLRSAAASGPRVPPALEATQPRTWHLPGTLEIRVERRPASDWSGRLLTLADAADLLREPVHFVLENARTDLAFLGHLAGPTNGATLRTLISHPGKIATHGGGGGEAKRWLEALTQGAPTPEKWRQVLRAWVLFDQDAGDADVREPSGSAVRLMKICEDVASVFGVGLSWICLRRREIESYVPDSGLHAEAPATHTPLVQQVIAWRADPVLAPHAWAFDLKKGLRGDLRASLPQADREGLKDGTVALAPHMLKPPFDGLTPTEVATLDRGLKNRLGEAFLTTPPPSWTANLPAEYDRGPPHPGLPAPLPPVPDQPPRLAFVQSLFDRM
ncbi:MAG: hypothetical protein QM820_28790 [Minicystis sp.]